MLDSFKQNGQKLYRTPMGLLPSVNTILDLTEPEEEQERLEQWRQRTPKHEEIRQQSLERGTTLHELAAEFLSGDEPTWIDPQIEPWWRSLLHYLKGISRTAVVSHPLYGGSRLAIELPVYHPELGYAGTLDWMGEREPLALTLTDFKSSRWKKKDELLIRHRLQAAAYRMAATAMLGVEFDHTDIVVALPKYPAQVVHLTPNEMDTDNEGWLKRLEQFRAMGVAA